MVAPALSAYNPRPFVPRVMFPAIPSHAGVAVEADGSPQVQLHPIHEVSSMLAMLSIVLDVVLRRLVGNHNQTRLRV